MNIVSDFSCIFSKTPKNKQNTNHYEDSQSPGLPVIARISGVSVIPGPDWRKVTIIWNQFLAQGVLKPISAYSHLCNQKGHFAMSIYFFSFFFDERKGELHLVLSLLGGPVVLSWEEKGCDFFFLLSKILSGSYCSVFIVCCFLSTAWLLPPV